MYRIDKDIVIPSIRRPRGPKYPFKSLELGDSFFVPTPKADTAKVVAILAATAYRMKRDHGLVFTLRTVKRGVRVWRISEGDGGSA